VTLILKLEYSTAGVVEGYITPREPTMDRETFTATVRTFKHRTPFRPFTIVTVSGGRHEIDHSDAIVARDGVALFATPGGIPVIFDYDGVSEVIGDLASRGVEN
jgi:hypothetical protein